ncbi:MAG: hypothetical protein EOP11_09015, partial [Proteobacteria bacterium]
MRIFKKFWLTSSLALLAPAAFASQNVTLQGKLTNASGLAVNGAATQFRVKIITPNSNACVLYDETQTVDLSQSNGLFSVNLNSGSGVVNAPTTYSLEQAISNRTGFAVDSAYCDPSAGTGTISYSPLAGDNRKVIISFRDPGSMLAFEDIPAMDLNPVPYAIESRSIGGYPAGSILRIDNAGTPGLAAPLTGTQFSELQSLLNGSSTNYMSSSAGSTTGARLPSVSGAPATPAAGSIWFDSATGQVKYYASGTVQTVGTSSTSGTITGVTAGTGLAGGGTSGTVSLSLSTSGVGAAGSVGSGSSVPVISYDTYGRITGATSSPISGLLPTGAAGRFLRSDGTSWTAQLIKLADVKNTAGSAGIFTTIGCSAAQALYWDSVNDEIKCQAIGGLNASAISSGTFAAARLPNLAGDITGPVGTTVVAAVGGQTATNVAAGAALANNSTAVNLASTIIRRDVNGFFSAGAASLASVSFRDSAANTISLAAPSAVTTYSLTLPAAKATVAGQMLASDTNGVLSWMTPPTASSGNVNVSAPITNSGTAAAPVIGIPAATSSQAGYLTSADWTTFNAKLSASLSSAQLFVGSAGGVATPVSASGDVSLATGGAFTVTGIRGRAVSATAPTTAGQVLRYDGTSAYAPAFISMADLRSTTTGSSAITGSCSASQTLTWNSGVDNLACQAIGGLDAGAVFSSGVVPNAYLPASATYWQTATGGISTTAGNVGIGTPTPRALLDVGGLTPVNPSPLALFGSNINAASSIEISNKSSAANADSRIIMYDDAASSSTLNVVQPSTGHTGGALLGIPRATSSFIFANGSRDFGIGTVSA